MVRGWGSAGDRLSGAAWMVPREIGDMQMKVIIFFMITANEQVDMRGSPVQKLEPW